MDQEQWKEALLKLWQDCGAEAPVFEEGGEWLTVVANGSDWLPVARQLRRQESMQFDFLFCLTCIDGLLTAASKDKLTMVYHLLSRENRMTLVVKCPLPREAPEIESVVSIWKTAEFHEREVYDLFGVRFHHHPDLRRLLLTDDWIGWPLRKDYEDPVNMIKL